MIYSRQREVIYEALQSNRIHPTAEELYGLLRGESPAVSLATVYRNLNQLTESGKVMRISFPNGPDRFDPVNDGHYHMTCTVCGAVVDIPRSALPELAALARKNTGLAVSESRVAFSGLCPHCEAAHKSGAAGQDCK